MRRATLFAALAVLLESGAASAQTTVAVLGVEAVDAPLNMANLLSLALQNQVRQTGGFKLVAGKDLEEIKLVFGCVDEKPSCMAKAGRSLSAAKLTWGSLRKVGATYNLTIKWLDVPSARIEKFVSENITRPELSQADATQVIERLTRSFLVSNKGMIKVTANVVGAQVMLGARMVGTTEKDPILLRDVPSGTHLVRITKDGFRPWTQQVMVQGGETTEVDVELMAVEAGGTVEPPPPGGGEVVIPPPVKETSSKTGWKIAFWTGAVATLGLAIGTIYAGNEVRTANDDKKEAIDAYRVNNNDPTAFSESVSDVCAEADKVSGDAKDIKSACDNGSKFETIQFALLGTTIGVAAISAYLYYKAYISKPEKPKSEPEPDGDSSALREAPRPTWMLSPAIGPNGGGVGLEVNF